MSRTLFTSRFTGDLKEAEIRRGVRNILSLEGLAFMNQTHSDRVQIVQDPDDEFSCDALVTQLKGVGLAALAADCMPITFESSSVVGVAHVGRVGLLNGIAINTVKVMRELGAEEIVATIGPSICGVCYEVSPDMYEESIAILAAAATSVERHALDLRAGVTAQLSELRVNVRRTNLCTLESADYFSYRGGDVKERQAGIVSL